MQFSHNYKELLQDIEYFQNLEDLCERSMSIIAELIDIVHCPNIHKDTIEKSQALVNDLEAIIQIKEREAKRLGIFETKE